MPWSVKKDDRCPADQPWAVTKDDDNELEGCHASEDDAKKQQAALYANEGRSDPVTEATDVSPLRGISSFSEGISEAMRQMKPDSTDTTVEVELTAQRPPRDNIERSLARFTVSDDEELPTLAGHLAVFNQWSRISSMFEGEFMERIAPGAFAKTIAENRDRVQITFNHGHDPSLGDQVLADLRDLREDDIGAAYEADLFPEIPPLLMRGLRHGKYGASFRFSVVKEEPSRWWEKRPTRETEHNPDRLPERTVRELALYEFGPVTYPAYSGATAGVRSTTDYYMSQRLTGDPERLLEMIAAKALPSGAESSHSDEGSRVVAVPPPKRRFRTREDFIEWTRRI